MLYLLQMGTFEVHLSSECNSLSISHSGICPFFCISASTGGLQSTSTEPSPGPSITQTSTVPNNSPNRSSASAALPPHTSLQTSYLSSLSPLLQSLSNPPPLPAFLARPLVSVSLLTHSEFSSGTLEVFVPEVLNSCTFFPLVYHIYVHKSNLNSSL